jgi:hypothetical protein
MAGTNVYFRGQGRVYAAVRDVSGNPGKLIWLGNVSALSVTLETETLEHQESYSGQRLTDLKLIVGKTAQVEATLESWDLDNLALGLYGQTVAVTGAAVTNEVLPNTLVANDIVKTVHPKISSVTVKDSATPTAATLVANTNYEIENASFGRIKILNPASFVQPLKVDYTYAARKDVGMFTQPVPERSLIFHGLNTAVGNTPMVVELFRVQLNPLSQLPLIGDEVAAFTLAGEALVDDTKSPANALGQFGRILDLT